MPEASFFRSSYATGRQFALYLVFSGLAAALNLGVGISLYASLGGKGGGLYAASVSTGYVAGMVLNFALNRAFTFTGDGRRSILQLRSFLLVSGFGLLLNTLVATTLRWIATDLLGAALHSDARWIQIGAGAHAASIGLVSIYSFVAHKYLTFSGGIRSGFSRALGSIRVQQRIASDLPQPETPATDRSNLR
jgi:putative flippase GtrA